MNIKLLLIITLLFTLPIRGFSQITFQKECGGPLNGNSGYSVRQTNDGNYIFTGDEGSFGSGGDVYLIKTNIYGDTLWTAYIGSGGYDNGNSVLQTFDGNYIVAGASTTGGAEIDFYLVKTDTIGIVLWTKTFGGSNNDWANSIAQMNDGGFIIAGSTQSFGAGGTDIYLIRTNAVGDTLWTKTYGGAADDYGNSVQLTSDGGFIISGWTNSFGAGGSDCYLLKTNSLGNLIWAKTFGGANSDGARAAVETYDGGYIFSGFTKSFGAGMNDAYLAKTDSNGNLLWSKTYGDAGNESINDLQQTSDGGFILTGSSYNLSATNINTYLVRTNSIGDTIWTQAIGGNNTITVGYSVKQVSDGGFIVTGNSNIGAGLGGVYFLKTDSNGNTSCPASVRSTTIGTPLTQVTLPFTIVNTPHTNVGSPTPTIFGRAGDLATACFVLGINDLDDKTLNLIISPNPCNDKLTITTKANSQSKIIIYDIAGRNLLQQEFTNETTLNTEQLATGIYIIEVHSSNGESTKGKVIKL